MIGRAPYSASLPDVSSSNTPPGRVGISSSSTMSNVSFKYSSHCFLACLVSNIIWKANWSACLGYIPYAAKPPPSPFPLSCIRAIDLIIAFPSILFPDSLIIPEMEHPDGM